MRDVTNGVALEILCRVFEDGADVAMEEWRDFYKPHEWISWPRALGAFIWRRLQQRSGALNISSMERAARHFDHLSLGGIGVEDYRVYAAAIRAAVAHLKASGASRSEFVETAER